MSSKLSKNIEERGDASMDYDLSLNQNGNGFTDTVTCPILSFSGSSSGSTYSENIPTFPLFDGSQIFCSGSSLAYP
jgi:hypothetical protein